MVNDYETDDEYWQETISLGNLGTVTERALLLHSSKERYGPNYREIFGTFRRSGEKLYWHARAVERPRLGPLANLQGWYYPNERAAMLWEVDIFAYSRLPNPLEDPFLNSLWGVFEGIILDRSPGVRRIYTPAWEPVYAGAYDKEYQEFLKQKGYQISLTLGRVMFKEV